MSAGSRPDGRVVGRMVGEHPGPTLVAVGGIHGNEPAGLEAARRVLSVLDPSSLRGEVLALSGNQAALGLGARYQVKDLNRQWTAARVAELYRLEASAHDAEDREQRALLDELEAASARARGPLCLADLHTSSASGIPFAMTASDAAHEAFVRDFRIPMISGLETLLAGVLSTYFSQRGWVAFSVEGGQHDDPTSVDSLAAVLWQSLAAGGLIDTDRPEVAEAAAHLDRRRGELPRRLEVLSRHAITAADRFVMEPGFRNIERARSGQLLARDVRGEIRAPHDGLVILPLYQGLGDDGYFWGRELAAG